MSEKEKLQKIRKRIDSLDEQIQDLINQRASAAQEVAKVKTEGNGDTFFYRPPPVTQKVEELKMLLEHCQWNPNLEGQLSIDEKDTEDVAKELIKFHSLFGNSFGRIEHNRLGLAYFSGLISNVGSKSVEPIALELLSEKSVRSLQRFMKTYRWDH